jgi:5-methylcytosine-specific restriction protein B
MSENIIQQSLQGILDSYINARTNQTFAGHSIRLVFKSIQEAVNSLPAVTVSPTLRVKWSIGQGTWAKVPWIALLDERETDTTQRGVYCVYLFRQDMSGIYLTLNQGVTKLIQGDGKLGAYSILRARAQELRPMCASLIDKGFRLDGAIDLKADQGLGSDYEPSTIAHKFYESGYIPDDNSLAADLDALISIYQKHLNVTDEKRRNEYHSAQDTRLLMHEFTDSLRAMKFSGIQHGTKFVTSLLAKNLVILTGNSGTGKTKIATLFTQWLFQSKSPDELSYVSLIPVGADWTDNRHV